MSPHREPGWASANVYAYGYITICGARVIGRTEHRLQLRLQSQPPDLRFSVTVARPTSWAALRITHRTPILHQRWPKSVKLLGQVQVLLLCP